MSIVNGGSRTLEEKGLMVKASDKVRSHNACVESIVLDGYVSLVESKLVTTADAATCTRALKVLTADKIAFGHNMSRALDIVTAATAGELSVVKIGDDKELVDNEQEQLRLLYSFLKHLPIKVVVIPYYEADDVIGYLVSKNQQYTNIIVSADKDYLQLVNSKTFVWSPQKKILYTPEVLTAEWKTAPENITYVRALVGDTSDKLSGVKGIGQDTVFKLLPQLHTEIYESFDQFWGQVENLEEGKSKTIKSLKENKEQAKTMYKLMKLDYTCLNQKAIEMLDVQLTEQENKDFSKVSFKLFCVKQKLESYIKNFDLWIRPFLFLKKDVKLKV